MPQGIIIKMIYCIISTNLSERVLMQKGETNNTDKVLSLALDLGKSMVKCGAEINRVEETVVRICFAYGVKRIDVFSIISMMQATAIDKEGNPHTQVRRIYSTGTDFGRLEKLNELSRKICSTTPDVDTARDELKKITVKSKQYSLSACLGYMLAAGSFTIFFGGSVLDCAAATVIAAVIYLLSAYITVTGVNRLFFTAFISAVAGFLAIGFVHLGFGNDANMIMIGDIMLIIPGLKLINSVREMLCGDIMSGLLRLIESVILSVAIAGGFAVALMLTGKAVMGG